MVISNSLKVGERKGCFHLIGDPLEQTDKVLVCEGYSTGASIYEATGLTTIIVFDAGNIESAVQAIRAKYPKISIFICADDDFWKPRNIGKETAQRVSDKHGCRVILPQFAFPTEPLTDFNDLHCYEDLEKVSRQIMRVIKALYSTESLKKGRELLTNNFQEVYYGTK